MYFIGKVVFLLLLIHMNHILGDQIGSFAFLVPLVSFFCIMLNWKVQPIKLNLTRLSFEDIPIFELCQIEHVPTKSSYPSLNSECSYGTFSHDIP